MMISDGYCWSSDGWLYSIGGLVRFRSLIFQGVTSSLERQYSPFIDGPSLFDRKTSAAAKWGFPKIVVPMGTPKWMVYNGKPY